MTGIFLSPDGAEIVVATEEGSFWIAPGARKARALKGFRGVHVSAVAWVPDAGGGRGREEEDEEGADMVRSMHHLSVCSHSHVLF